MTTTSVRDTFRLLRTMPDDAKVSITKAMFSDDTATDPTTRPGFGGYGDSDEKKKFKKGFLPPMPADAHEQKKLREKLASINRNDFPRGELKDNFSMARWALASQKVRSEGNNAFVRYAPWEKAYYDALYKAGMGDMVSGVDGGFLAPEAWSTHFLDQLYPQLAISRLPITRMDMATRVSHMPKLTGNVSTQWYGENAALQPTQAQFGQLSFTSRKLGSLVTISNELIMDSNPQAEAILTNNASRYMALAIDYAALLGNGQNGSPVGVYNATGVNRYPVAGSSLQLSDITANIFNVENLNGANPASTTNPVPVAQAQCSGIVGPVSLKRTMSSWVDASGSTTQSNRPIYGFGLNDMRWENRIDGAGALDGLLGVDTWVLSNNVQKTMGSGTPPVSVPVGTGTNSPLFFADWQHFVYMQRMDLEVSASQVAGTSFQNDQTWVRILWRGDFGLAHPEAFSVVYNAGV